MKLVFPCFRLALLLVTLLEGSHWASACGRTGNGCSIFNKCCDNFSCHPFIQKCYHKPRWEGEPCVAGHGCGPELQCEAGSQRCRAFGRLGAACHLTRKCADGFTCQPGVHKCYNSPRLNGQPCSAGYSCANRLHCEAGSQTCRPPGKLGDPCHATRPCDTGFSCQPGEHKCYDSPRKENQPCSAGFGCGPGLDCEFYTTPIGDSFDKRCVLGLGGFEAACGRTKPACQRGLSCQLDVEKCYNEPRRLGQPCTPNLFGCESGLVCNPEQKRCITQEQDAGTAKGGAESGPAESSPMMGSANPSPQPTLFEGEDGGR